MGNDWFHEYFINELKAIGRKPTSNMQHEVVDSLPSSGNEQTIYFVKNDSSSSNNHYDEYVWISSSSAFEKIGSTQIDGSATQPDWNQNDETAADYVKNRPFYTGDPVETVLVEESTVSFTDTGSGFYMGELQSTIEATLGEIYKVSWDSVTYECTCISFNGMAAIGNLSITGAGSDTGEPFIIVTKGGQIQIATADTGSSHTISISGITISVVKIDPKYIRDMYYTADPVETVLVEESTVAFAEDSGGYTAQFPSTVEVTAGETYKVSWDGTAYECACVLFRNVYTIGNLSIQGMGPDTGEPFLIVVKNGKSIFIGTVDTSASHTISISSYIESVVKINPKYLPMASKTEPGIIDLDNLDNNVLRLVKEEYFTPIDFQVSGYGDANTIEECANRNNSYGIYMPGKSNGAVLSYYKDSVNNYITSVLSGGEYINCYKFSLGSISEEQLWGISKDGVVISSSTANSTKKFRITVDDSGTLKAAEVT